MNLVERIEQLYEPAARAARRGDPDQIKSVLEELRSLWRSHRDSREADAEVAKGMTYSIEGILGIVLATAGADARQALIEGRKYALPILHALGQKAREAVLAAASTDQGRATQGSLRMGDLATKVGALPQNIGELVKTMSDCGLVTLAEEGTARLVALTPLGAQLLEASKPGWQLTDVDHDPLTQRLEEKVRLALQQLEKQTAGIKEQALRAREEAVRLAVESEPRKVYVQIHRGLIQPTPGHDYGWIEAPRAARAFAKEGTYFTKISVVNPRARPSAAQLLRSGVIAEHVRARRMGHGEE